MMVLLFIFFFFFNDTATTEIYTLSLHDALPISRTWYRAARFRGWCAGPAPRSFSAWRGGPPRAAPRRGTRARRPPSRSEEHTSELQSQSNLVCRLLLEKKKNSHVG